MRFLAIEAGCFIGGEVIGTAGAQVIDQMGEALLQRFNRRVFVIGPTRSLEEAKQEHAGLTLLADAQADGPEHHAERRLAFPLAFTVINVQLTMAAFAAVCCCDDPDTSGHGQGSYGWSLPRSFNGTADVPAPGITL